MADSINIRLHDYQELILDEVFAKFHFKRHLVSTLGMGGGKTIIIGAATKHYYEKGESVAVLTNISDLIPQLKNHLLALNLPVNIIKSGYDLRVINTETPQIYLIMEQSFHENFRSENSHITCDLLIKDEYHIGKGSKRYEDIKEFLNPERVLGLTGTPFDNNGFLMDGVELEDLITHGSTAELTAKGYLTPLKYYVPHWATQVDYSKISCTEDYSTKELEYKINTPKHNKMILQSMNEMDGKNKKTLVYCNSIEHSKNVCDMLREDGYKVGVVNSDNESSHNEDVIKRFGEKLKSKDAIDCIVSVSKLTTGFNQPQAEMLVLARPTKILRLYLQILFRVARRYEGKKFGIILDLAQCVSQHGFGTQEQIYIKSNSLTKEEKRQRTIEQKVKAKVRLEAMKSLSKDDFKAVEITETKLNMRLKELRIKNVDIKGTVTKDLINIFKNTIDVELIVSIGHELNSRINKRKYENEELLKLVEGHLYDFEETEKKDRNRFLSDLKEGYRKRIKEKA